MKVWITKYALSGGVEIANGRYGTTWDADAGKDREDRDWVRVDGYQWTAFRIGRDACLTEGDALRRVGEMVKAKQRSLAKQQAALTKIAEAVEVGRLPMAAPKKGAKS